MQFSAIPGLEELKQQLIQSYKRGKVAHAQLYAGNAGTSTFALAWAYATYLMCQNKQETDSCGTCANCSRMKKCIHPDVHWYFPKVAAADRGKYDKVLAEALPIWRSFATENPYGTFEDWAFSYGQENKNLQLSREDSRQILRNVSMRSVEGGYKILFIWGASYMHSAGANAILKVLEEPPAQTLYLLVTHHYEGILQTIRSRTQLINVPPNSREEISDYLAKEKAANTEHAQKIAEVAQGRIGSALRLLQNDETLAYTAFREWMLYCWNRDYTALVKASEEFSKTDKASQRGFLTYSLSLIRNAVLKEGGAPASFVNEEEDQFITKFAQRLRAEKLYTIYSLLNEAIQHLERNANPRITHLNLSLSIVSNIND